MDSTVEIKNDVFNIAKRIKEIDKGYFVVYNRTKKRFEVHNRKNKPTSLAVVLPYNTLDSRAYSYVLKTRIERLNKIASEIELNNLRNEMNIERQILDEAGYKSKHLAKHIARGKSDLPFYNEI